MLKKVLLAFVLGGGGYLIWRYFQIVNDVRIESAEGDGGFLMASFNSAADDVTGVFMDGLNDNLTPSFSLIAFLKDYEQFKSMPYYATEYEKQKGIQTIGYGHVIKKGESFDLPMTKETADELFLKDLNYHIELIYSKVKVKLNQHQFDALCSFHFNAGRNALSVYTGLRNYLNAGDFDNAANKFMEYTKQGGVVIKGLYNRRYSEFRMFKFGVYERFTG